MDVPVIGRGRELAVLETALSDGRGAILIGPAGAGKTRLLEEASSRAEASGFGVVPIKVSAAEANIPFAAVSQMITDAGPADRLWLLKSVRRQIEGKTTSTGLVVAVDDLNHLDQESSGLIHQMVRDGSCCLLATVRSEFSGDQSIVEHWKDGPVARVDIGPLDRASSQQLIKELLGAPASVALNNRIWQITEGNPLYLNELVTASIESGQIELADDYWDLKGHIATTVRLQDLMDRRITNLSKPEAEAFYAVALSEPIRLSMALKVADHQTLASLEEQGLLKLENGSTQSIRCSHPLFGELARDRMPNLVRADLLRRLADSAETEEIRPSDALRLATWLVEIGEKPSVELASMAAQIALQRFDPSSAESLILHIDESEWTADMMITLGRAVSMQGRHHEAEAVLIRALETATQSPLIAGAGAALAENRLFRFADPQAAVAAIDQALIKTDDPVAAAELEALAQLASAYGGDFDRAMSDGPPLLEQNLPARADVPLRMILSLGQAMTGQVDGTLECIATAERQLDELGSLHPLARDQLGLNRLLVYHALGEWDHAANAVAEVIESEGEHRLIGPWLYLGAATQFFLGDIDWAVIRSGESVELHREYDPLGTMPLALAINSLAHAMRGEVVPAQNALDSALAQPTSWPIRTQVWLGMAKAWVDVARGKPEVAAQIALETGDEAIEGGHTVWGAFALHTAARFGFPEVVSKSLAVVSSNSGPTVAVMAAHAEYATNGDTIGLEKTGQEMEAMHAYALAADVWAVLALNADEAGSRARFAVRARETLHLCSGLMAPLVAQIDAPLSRRQLEVGRLAAVGKSTREIADELFITRKTVDNHLQAVYRTLDLSGREELTMAFPQ